MPRTTHIKGDAILIDIADGHNVMTTLLRMHTDIQIVKHRGWAYWRKGSMRVWYPWSGLIIPIRTNSGWKVLITGVTDAAVRVAALKFITLRTLKRYCAAPFCQLP